MVIMLVAVAVVFGGIFGFQAFKAMMIKKFMSAMARRRRPSRRQGRQQRMAAEDRSGRQPARREGRRPVAGSVGRGRSISFNSGDDVERRHAAVEAARPMTIAKLESLQATAT
jgi:membrane fusion protein (multidrug efflux system)